MKFLALSTQAVSLTRRAVLTGAVSLIPTPGTSRGARSLGSPSQTLVLTFEDLGLAPNSERPLDTAYGGFTWTQTGILRSLPGRSQLGYRPMSGSTLAFYAEANGADVSGYPGAAGTPIIVRRVNGAKFAFLGAAFSSADTSNLLVFATALLDGRPVGTLVFPTTVGSAGPVTFSAEDGFGYMDELRLQSSGYFGFDDFSYRLLSTAPEGSMPVRPATPVEMAPLAPAVLAVREGGDIVGFTLQNTTGRATDAQFVRFNQQFAISDLPKGRQLLAVVEGQARAVQMDVQQRHSDGSVKSALLTVFQPSTARGAVLRGMLRATLATPAPPLPLNQALLGGYDLTVTMNIAGEAYRVDAAQQLTDAISRNTLKVYRRGSHAVETRVDVPIAGSLRVSLVVSAYADGATATQVQFNNDIAMGPTGGSVRFESVSIVQGGQPKFRHGALVQHQYQSWCTTVWHGASAFPTLHIVHNLAYRQQIGVFQGIDLSLPPDRSYAASQAAIMANSNQWTEVLGSIGVTRYMPTTGGRPDIGAMTAHTAVWMVTQTKASFDFMLGQARAAGGAPWNMYDQAHGTYVSLDDHPRIWLDNRAPAGGTALTQAGPGPDATGWTVETAHMPDLAFAAFMVTGDHYFLDRINAQAAWSIANVWWLPRLGGVGLVSNEAEQNRAQAWIMRQVEAAAFANPDGSKEKSYFSRIKANNWSFVIARIPERNAKHGQISGFIAEAERADRITGPVSSDFYASSAAIAALRGDRQARKVLKWMANFLTGRFLSPDMNPHLGYAYLLTIGAPSAGPYFTTWAQVQAAMVAQGRAAAWSRGDRVASGVSSGGFFAAVAAMGCAEIITVFCGGTDPSDHAVAVSAMWAYGWLNWANDPNLRKEPQHTIVPRMPDGTQIGAGEHHVLRSGSGSTHAFSGDNVLIYDAGTGGNILQGGPRSSILIDATARGGDTLVGGASDDYLIGGVGANTFRPGPGYNICRSGAGPAVFEVDAAAGGTMEVLHFKPTSDRIRFPGVAAGTSAGALSGATMRGADTYLTVGGAVIRLVGLSLSQLNASHLI